MNKTRIFCSIALFLLFGSSICLANGLNLNSLGSRALAMGGAFVGLADDFSAVFWNPAGMAQFEKKYFGFYGVDLIPKGTYTLEIPGYTAPLVDAKTESKQYLAGMAAFYLPVSSKLVAGFSVYTPSGLGATWKGDDFKLISFDKAYSWKSKIGMVTFAPAVAYKFSDNFMIGASLNINYGMFNLSMHAGGESIGFDLGQYEEKVNGWGYGATIGILAKPHKMISIGATFRTASKVKFSGDTEIANLGFAGLNPKSGSEREVTWPMWIAGGVAVKPVEGLTVTADVQWTQWSVIDVMTATYLDPMWQVFMGLSGDDERPMYWEDKMQIRFGGEYLVKNLAFRAGYYIDPAPAPDRTMNVLLPSFDFNVVTVGFGYRLDGLQVDLAFEYLMGKDREIDPLLTILGSPLYDPEYDTAQPGKHTMKILVPNISVSYRF
ncbi:MAG: outer membrane protein transport protein [Candidatus Aminicenantes bacterium]|nr:outer membrane protein transport protein [Candidatus Aminicenantes bacterium]